MEDIKEITLSKAIPVTKEGGGTAHTNIIHLRRLKAKDLKLIPESMFDQEKKVAVKPHEVLPLIAALADLSEASVGEIDASDLFKITSELESFLTSQFPETGKK
jgi:hypothetical protein